MKRFISVILVLFFSCFLLTGTGCKPNSKENSKLKIICTVFPQYDIVRNIVGENADIMLLVPFGVESHDFSLENISIAELKNVATADIIISVGGESDSPWIKELKDNVNNPDGVWLQLTDMVETLHEVHFDNLLEHGHDHSGEEHHHENSYDEHVWTSPKRMIKLTDGICKAIVNLDEDNKDFYLENSLQYKNKLLELDARLTEIVANGKRNTLIFGDRFPFRYLCEDYGLTYDAAFSGCSAVADPSVTQLAFLTERAINSGAKVIFYIENSKSVYAKQIAEKVGCKAMMLHSCHTLTKGQLDRGADYISVMNDNIDKISEALE